MRVYNFVFINFLCNDNDNISRKFGPLYITFIMFHFKTKWFGLTLLQPSIGNAKTSRYTVSHLLLKWTATIDRFNYVFVRILVIFVSWLQTKTSALKVSYLCILIPIFMLMTSIANDQCGFSRNFHVSFSLKYLLIWRKKVL